MPCGQYETGRMPSHGISTPGHSLTRTAPSRPGSACARVDDDTFELSESFLYTGGPRAGPMPVTAEHPRSHRPRVDPELPRVVRASQRTPHACRASARPADHHEPERLPEDQRLSPVVADRLFRDVLIECDVPLVRAYILWTGVTLRTRWHANRLSALALVLWFVAALAGTVLVVIGVLSGNAVARARRRSSHPSPSPGSGDASGAAASSLATRSGSSSRARCRLGSRTRCTARLEYAVIGIRYVFRRRPSDKPSEAPKPPAVRQAIDTAHVDR